MALLLTGITDRGQERELPALIRADLLEDRFGGSPKLEAELLMEPDFPALRRFRLLGEPGQDGDRPTLLEGEVDTQTIQLTPDGARILLTGRGPGALLEDNEIRPDTYFKLTGQGAYETFAKGYGEETCGLSNSLYVNYLLIEKGMSRWDALDLFCRMTAGKPVFVTRHGVLKNSAQDCTQELTLADEGAGKIALTRRRDKLLSRVYLKTDYAEDTAEYNRIFDNPRAADHGIRRECYLHPNERWYRDLDRCGQDAIAVSNRTEEVLEAVIPGDREIQLGATVSYSGKVGTLNGYRVFRVKHHWGADGTNTALWACWGEDV